MLWPNSIGSCIEGSFQGGLIISNRRQSLSRACLKRARSVMINFRALSTWILTRIGSSYETLFKLGNTQPKFLF
jgi:hypothetical protein